MRKTLFLLPVLLIAAGCRSEAEDVGTSVEITTTTMPTAVANACVASDLEVSLDDVNATAGDFVVKLTSRDDDACSIQGAPTVALFNDDVSLPTTAVPATGGDVVELSDGDSAYFGINYDADAGSAAETANWIYVTVPGDDQSLRLPLEGTQVGNIANDTSVTVSAVRATAWVARSDL